MTGECRRIPRSERWGIFLNMLVSIQLSSFQCFVKGVEGSAKFSQRSSDAIKNKHPKRLFWGRVTAKPGEQAFYAARLNTAACHSQVFTFFHPDCTVGPGVSPDHARLANPVRLALAGYTADRELAADTTSTPHPAPKVTLDDCS
jgi:hypothetical protein